LLDTYRWLEHCGPNYDNDLGYRTVAEFEAWRERCPVRRFGELLLSNGALDRSAEAAMEAAIAAEIERTFAAVKAAPFPKPETASTFVYA
jgi:pyruvate dehydrogenase E1 component alpha subunit